jgi:nucleotide-binding universal stress UspA family protein
MFKRILVPLDGSTLAERALAPALALAQAVEGEGEVRLLCVPLPQPMNVERYSGGYSFWWPEQARERACCEGESYLDGKREAWARPGVAISTQTIEGDPPSMILDAAREWQADMIALSPHGYSGLTRWVLGSVAEKVLRAATCPVLLVRSVRPLQTVLIPLDGSRLAEQALAPGMEMARLMGAEVRLLTVTQAMAMPVAGLRGTEWMAQDIVEQLTYDNSEEATRYLEHVKRRYRNSGLVVKTEIVEGVAAYAILEYVAAEPVDLIVMATHGRTGLRRWAFGSVTEKVLRGSDVSMLTIRPPAGDLRESPPAA